MQIIFTLASSTLIHTYPQPKDKCTITRLVTDADPNYGRPHPPHVPHGDGVSEQDQGQGDDMNQNTRVTRNQSYCKSFLGGFFFSLTPPAFLLAQLRAGFQRKLIKKRSKYLRPSITLNILKVQIKYFTCS